MSDKDLKKIGAEYDKHSSKVPSGRVARLSRLGSLAAGLTGGMLSEGAKHLAKGKRPTVNQMLLTPANAKRVADQLSQMRGAAMKVGQLLSMDAGDLLPEELSLILSKLRSDAKPMPFSQLTDVLQKNWGENWNANFKQFSFKPDAAASIGQVHSANTKDGRHLALKVQYPGVGGSVSSDVDNVATLLRLSQLLPKGLDIDPLLEEAKQQLQAEADYLQEASWLKQYRTLLEGDENFVLPEVYDELTTKHILAMSYVGGVPVESLVDASQEDRDRVVSLLMRLLFREIFEFRVVQTDPNFANYQYDESSKQLVLLDFGATRAYSKEISDAYLMLMQGAVQQDRDIITNAAEQIGFFQLDIQEQAKEAVIDLFQQACEPLCYEGEYDFGNSDLATRIRENGMALSMEKDYWHTPPADALFLHRKLGGLYLLAVKLKAKVDMNTLFKTYI